MENNRKWQKLLIIALLALTAYNILPTVFFYTKPLDSPVDAKQALVVAEDIQKRVNTLESDSIDWIYSFCNNLKIKPRNVKLDPEQPETIQVEFNKPVEAQVFRDYLERAGSLIPFVPSQLSPGAPDELNPKAVTVLRRIPIHFEPSATDSYFTFSTKLDQNYHPTPLYEEIVNDRLIGLALATGGLSENGHQLQALSNSTKNPKFKFTSNPRARDALLSICGSILNYDEVFQSSPSIKSNYFASFSPSPTQNVAEALLSLIRRFKNELSLLTPEEKSKQDPGASHESLLTLAENTITQNASLFVAAKTPWSEELINSRLKQGQPLQILDLDGRHPFIQTMTLDYTKDQITFKLSPAYAAFKNGLNPNAGGSRLQDRADSLLFNEIASIRSRTGETLSQTAVDDIFVVNLSSLPGSSSFLVLNLSQVAASEANSTKKMIEAVWKPKSGALQGFKTYAYEEYTSGPGLVIQAPSSSQKSEDGFRPSSIYIVAKGILPLLKKANDDTTSPENQAFIADYKNLKKELEERGFYSLMGGQAGLTGRFGNELVFVKDRFYADLLKASREEFTVHGTHKHAVLEFSTYKQRIIATNRIEDSIQENLLKWKDDYQAARLSTKGLSPLDVPKPTKKPLFQNLALSARKYFRGDDKKTLNMGLDLSGGKTVHLALLDSAQKPITSEIQIKQGIEEIYQRVNKLGVSEVSIRQEGDHVTLDFPGSQALSAAELIKSSSMHFHFVNEKFGPNNPLLAEAANRFLQEVWNKAVVTGKTEKDEIQKIAFKHLYGEGSDEFSAHPMTPAAQKLYDANLRLAGPEVAPPSSDFNQTYSAIAIYRGDDVTEWYGQSHPLLIVFRNFALEGANLADVRAEFESSKGNYLTFSVKGSSKTVKGIDPREQFFEWTSPFSKEEVANNGNGEYSNGNGWRMAIDLNDTVISAPPVHSPLRDSASITGSFTQREAAKLEADLKAGSLSFSPKILSEQNVSPELGAQEKHRSMLATALSLILVIGVMIAYYRFGGVVASVAVILNLLIIWAVMQNIQATLTLAGIAAIILTMGMAVDANVLVFERIREEFAKTGRIALAVKAGYGKAFSAIVDSNLTTIIAALVLLQFDSGPIKGFATTIIIGIASSMITALFMTRFFFEGWVMNPKHKELKMAQWFKPGHFDFLRHSKLIIVISTLFFIAGGASLFKDRSSVLGMDFTGGYSLNIELQPTENGNYREQVEKAFANTLSPNEINIRELSPSNNMRLFFSKNLQTKPEVVALAQSTDPLIPYQANPQLAWIMTTLDQNGVKVTDTSKENVALTWSEVSGQMSTTMRNNAIFGLIIAMIGILIYITIRFEFKYAISTTLCIVYDVTFATCAIGILHLLGVPVQLDLNTIAALMTIVGYSLNDTIIVFDRIREEMEKAGKGTKFITVINTAINSTLGRTIMTSLTTLLVLVPLVAFGGSSIFGFALVMLIGVIFGTLSSFFVAAPLINYFHKKEEAKNQTTISRAK